MERYGCGVHCTRFIGSGDFSNDLEAGNDVFLGNPGDLSALAFDPGAMVLCERSMNCVAGFTGGARFISNEMYMSHANPSTSVVIENLGYEITNHDFHFGSPYLPVLDEILYDVFGGVIGDLCNPCHWMGAQITSYVEECEPSDDQNELVLTRNGEESVRIQLLDMLQMVDDRYSRCLDEFGAVLSSFYAMGDCFAYKTIIYLNEKLKNKIKKHLVLVGNYLGSKDQRGETSLLQHQWILQQLRRKGHQLWKPQRGLPERSVSVLRAWMFQNFIHPYPNDTEKQELAIKSGLARSQVSNWFINARVRLWKPLIEEMYVELRKKKVIIEGGG